MALRSSWKGFIKLSLVSVPVKAFTAHNAGQEIRLNQLHADCNNRIKYKKTCPEHGEVSNDEIVSGYEYDKGKYVVIDVDELDKLRTENDRSVNIQGFIPADTIDPIFHTGRTYYLTPDGPVGQKPYALLRDGMNNESVQAIARVVISKKEQVVLLRIIEDLLAMTVLSYNYQVKGLDAFQEELTEVKTTEEELNLTTMLIKASTLQELDLDEYKDDYTNKLTELIQKKIEGEEIVQVPDPEKPKIVNLMDALKQSVAAAQGMEPEQLESKAPSSGSADDQKEPKPKTKKASKKMAPSAKKTAKSKTKKKSKAG